MTRFVSVHHLPDHRRLHSCPPRRSSDLATANIYVVTIGVAAISLVVGGIVVMNIMLVSVTERTREMFITTMPPTTDRKSTRLNSSPANISYAVFCLTKKKPSGSAFTRSA